jgi:hypothetical protein
MRIWFHELVGYNWREAGAMKRVFRLVIVAMVLTMAGAVVPATPIAVAQEFATQPVGMVSGAWRMMAWQFALAPAFPEQGLEKQDGHNWGILIADMTNTGVASGLAVADVKLGEGEVGGDPAKSVEVSRALGFTAIGDDGVLPVAENGIARVAVAFHSAGDPMDMTISVGEQRVSVASVRSDTLDIAGLPQAPAAMQLEVGMVQTLPSAANLSLTVQSGEARDVAMNSVQAPSAESCFGPESIAHVTAVSGGTVWVETIPGIETPTVWVDDAANARFTLLALSLVFAGAADADGTGVYGAWLAPLADQIEEQKIGLWDNCRGASGEYINPPPPTPVPTPSAEEIRAQYTWVDTRELISRPFQYEGQKIAVSGEVFTLDVDEGGTGMQIWVDTPNGREAVVIVAIGNQTPGLYEGMWVTVYGTGQGTFTGTNGFGAQITQPLIRADIIDY